MRVKRQLAGFVLLGTAALITTASEDSPLLTLNNNPFSRPQMLKVKPAPVNVQVVRKTEPVDLDLTATMVSDNAPMIIVDGELLALGESIRGLKLVKVKEGQAVFARAGKTLTFTLEGLPQ
jgi:hypothetical protein